MRVLVLLLAFLAAPALAGSKVAFFGMHMLDTSLQTAELGQNPEEVARVQMLHDMVEARFRSEGYLLVDLSPVAEELNRVKNPAKCYGCDTRMAARLGADYALVGEVQKVSNLILTLNLQMRETRTGTMVRGAVVDIRGNTDESWRRGMRYILDNRIFKEEESPQ
ncbi:uncharacterized protein DUF2380 [Rhodovulum imhoffii]|uniref:Uncharacterized protein DUF2380 n=1 Tax=Rhodovulum imhoffii TaxID=365340 RepID=A0A2T5BWT3_9RHOB|nr:DUF3280 domain-containing protein [Rhodovulum imhoffii]MBK5933310.1 hypothetical protein [Rhodovulum imhoffii]PTN04068.1 uncharacterized protein DUF2380 [Rhodovulum imhoffii]